MKRLSIAILVALVALAAYLLWRPDRDAAMPPSEDIAAVETPEHAVEVDRESSLPTAPTRDRAPTNEAPEPASIPEGMFRVEGRVENTQGEPVPGARLALFHDTKSWGLDDATVDETVSDEEGGFYFPSLVAFATSINHSYAQDTFVIFASHPDYGMSWKSVVPAPDHSNYVVTLGEAVRRTVHVIDPDGNPIQGVRVSIYGLGDRESPRAEFREYINLRGDLAFESQVSDAAGQVVFANLPDTQVSLYATKEGYARGVAFSDSDTIVMTPGAQVSGRVATKSGQPVAGAIVSFGADTWNNYLRGMTDADGRYTITGIPGDGFEMSAWREGQVFNGDYHVTLKSDAYTFVSFPIHLDAGEVIDDLDLVAEPGVLVRCLVVDEATGDPVSGVRVHGRNEIGNLNGYSNSEGVFEVCVLPGETRLQPMSPPEGVYYDYESARDDPGITFVASGPTMEVTMLAPAALGRLVPLAGSVAAPPGVDLSTLTIHAAAGSFMHSSGGGARPTGVNADGTFELRNLPGGREIILYAITEDGAYGGISTALLPNDPSIRVDAEIELQPALEVRTSILDTDGNPAAGVEVSVVPMFDGDPLPRSGGTFTVDDQGFLRFPGALPGVEYSIQAQRPRENTTALRIRPESEEERIRQLYRVYTSVYVEP